MILGKEESLPHDYRPRGLYETPKSSSYMPPINSADKLTKHFIPPTQFQSPKRIIPFSYTNTPKRDFNTKFEVSEYSFFHEFNSG